MKKIFEQLNQDFLNALFSDAEFQKIIASGKSKAFLQSAESFRVENNRAIKTGLAYTYAQDRGVKNSVPVKALFDWLEFKKYGLTYGSDAERWKLAWALHFKIKKLGTWKYKKPTAMYAAATDVAIKKMRPKLYDVSADIVRATIFGR